MKTSLFALLFMEIAGAGLETAVAGSKGVALLQGWSHNGESRAARKSVVFFDGKTAAALTQGLWSKVGTTEYFDEGNRGPAPETTAELQ
ncbi:MAG: hypothetical protein ABSE62_09985 [Chthoniobacteraceae bacterium]